LTVPKAEGRSGCVCPCGSGQDLASCCGPCLSGEARAGTARELMRSRYTAYCLGDEAYLLRTWHADTRPRSLSLAEDGTLWLGLRILRCEAGGREDREGTVEFVAEYEQSGRRQSLHELSRFCRGDADWLYLDGQVDVTPALPAKQARNEPCACGSGRKYKKCCGSAGA
jgi:SEC-C motif domain protein